MSRNSLPIIKQAISDTPLRKTKSQICFTTSGANKFCGPCSQRHKLEELASIWCTDCSEALCTECSNYHRSLKTTRYHLYVSLSHMIPRQREDGENKLDADQVSLFSMDVKHISKVIADRKCSEHDESLRYYCPDDQKVVCGSCVTVKHRGCKKIISVAEVAKQMRKQREPKTISIQLDSYVQQAKVIVGDRVRQRNDLATKKQETVEKIVEFREGVHTFMTDLEMRLTESFLSMHEVRIKQIDQQLEVCNRIRTAAKADCSLMLAVDKNGNEAKLVKTIMDLDRNYPAYEKELREVYDSIRNVDYVFEPNPILVEILSSTDTLGEVEVRETVSKLPAFLSSSDKGDFSQRQAKPMGVFDGSHIDDKERCLFTGALFLTDGRMVLADHGSDCLKVFNSRGMVLQRLALDSDPWELALFDDGDKLAVTLPKIRQIHLVGIERELKVLKKITVAGRCNGIAYIEDKLYVSLDPWTKVVRVCIISPENGEELGTVNKDSKGNLLFKAPFHMARNYSGSELYVSDSGENRFIAFTPEGQYKFMYTDKDLTYPTGITVDCQENIYVCGKNSCNVHQVSARGKKMQVFNTEDSGYGTPRAICFEQYRDKFLLTDSEEGEQIGMYRLQ